jgi:hypothetical protein
MTTNTQILFVNRVNKFVNKAQEWPPPHEVERRPCQYGSKN